MSDYLAVGAVTAVLRSLLHNALTSGGPSTILGATPGITATYPDLITTGPNEQPQVNLFMYYVNVNPALRNLDLPSSNGQGGRISNPPLPLNLHFLVSAYGHTQFDPEILLAWAMKVFHNTPVVSPATIRSALADLGATNPSAEAQLIAGSTLAEQLELVRITPETLTTEEIYRLWAAFETSYRPSTALQVSVVVVQDTQPYTSHQAVQTRNVTVQPLQPPLIETITPEIVPAGQQLAIAGAHFLGDAAADTLVSFDLAAGLTPDTIAANLIRVTLPASLHAGTRELRVQRVIVFPGSSTAHPGFSSSSALFQLIPTITDASPIPATLGNPLTLTLSPEVGRAQQVVLYIGDVAIPIDQRPAAGPASSATVTFPIPADLPAGTFPLRIEIDGAHSAPSEVQVSP
jgi:Pvc16 N-terminal domain